PMFRGVRGTPDTSDGRSRMLDHLPRGGAEAWSYALLLSALLPRSGEASARMAERHPDRLIALRLDERAPPCGAQFVGCLKYFCRYFGSGGGWSFWIGIT